MVNEWRNSNAQTHNSNEAKESERKNASKQSHTTKSKQNKTTPTNSRLVVVVLVVVIVVVFCDISFFSFGAADIFDYIFLAQRKLSGRTAAKMRVRMEAKESKIDVYTSCGSNGCLCCTSMRPLVDSVLIVHYQKSML